MKHTNKKATNKMHEQGVEEQLLGHTDGQTGKQTDGWTAVHNIGVYCFSKLLTQHVEDVLIQIHSTNLLPCRGEQRKRRRRRLNPALLREMCLFMRSMRYKMTLWSLQGIKITNQITSFQFTSNSDWPEVRYSSQIRKSLIRPQTFVISSKILS